MTWRDEQEIIDRAVPILLRRAQYNHAHNPSPSTNDFIAALLRYSLPDKMVPAGVTFKTYPSISIIEYASDRINQLKTLLVAAASAE